MRSRWDNLPNLGAAALILVGIKLRDGGFPPLAHFLINLAGLPDRPQKGIMSMSKSWIRRTAGPRADESAVSFKIFSVMAVTSVLTFATLTTGYQLLFSHSVFA